MSCDYAVIAACCPTSVADTAFESLHRVPNKKVKKLNETKLPKISKTFQTWIPRSYQRNNIQQEDNERWELSHWGRATPVFRWMLPGWITQWAKKQTNIIIGIITSSHLCSCNAVYYEFVCLPETNLEMSCHVVPEIIAAHSTHKHIDSLYDLRGVFILLDFTAQISRP